MACSKLALDRLPAGVADLILENDKQYCVYYVHGYIKQQPSGDLVWREYFGVHDLKGIAALSLAWKKNNHTARWVTEIPKGNRFIHALPSDDFYHRYTNARAAFAAEVYHTVRLFCFGGLFSSV